MNARRSPNRLRSLNKTGNSIALPKLSNQRRKHVLTYALHAINVCPEILFQAPIWVNLANSFIWVILRSTNCQSPHKLNQTRYGQLLRPGNLIPIFIPIALTWFCEFSKVRLGLILAMLVSKIFSVTKLGLHCSRRSPVKGFGWAVSRVFVVSPTAEQLIARRNKIYRAYK